MSLEEFNDKIERLRFANRWSWEEVARALQLSRVMLLHLRKGTHDVSAKTLQRLTELDRKSGVGSDARHWIKAISERVQEQKITVTTSDVANGVLIAKVEYLVQGKPAERLPAKIELRRPPASEVSKLITNLMLDENFDSILEKTLPTKLDKKRFLNAITPFCYRELLEAAMILIFGFEWKKRLPQPPAKGGIR